MEIKRGDIVIRDMLSSDVADHVRWRTVDTEWMNWDAPWLQEPPASSSAVEHKMRMLAAAPPPAVRTRFEIATADGLHIGWMNSYPLDGVRDGPAIGIDIAEPRFRGEGRGEKAFSAFIHYLFSSGCTAVYTETWSGNFPMIRLAGKCGFEMLQRGHSDLEVHGERFDSLLFRVTRESFYEKQQFEPTPDLKRILNRCGWALVSLIGCAQAGAVLLALLAALLAPELLNSPVAALSLSAITLYGFGLPVFSYVLRKVPAASPLSHERPGSMFLLKLLVLCLGMGYLGQLAGTAVIQFLEKLLHYSYQNPLDSAVQDVPAAAVFLFAVVLAPIFEELMFRRILLSRLIPFGEEFAISFSALAFGLFHCNIGQFFYAYTVGAILAYAAVSTGRLHICILLHACFNLVGSLLLPTLLRSGQSAALFASLSALALMGAALVLFTRGRSRIHLHPGTLPLSDGQKVLLTLRSPGIAAFLALSIGLAAWAFRG